MHHTSKIIAIRLGNQIGGQPVAMNPAFMQYQHTISGFDFINQMRCPEQGAMVTLRQIVKIINELATSWYVKPDGGFIE